MRAKSPVCLWMATFNGPKVFRRLTPFNVLMNWKDNISVSRPPFHGYFGIQEINFIQNDNCSKVKS